MPKISKMETATSVGDTDLLVVVQSGVTKQAAKSLVAGAGSGDVVGPGTNTDNNIPQWDGADSKTLKDGLTVVTTVGDPGGDTAIPSEQAVREALDTVDTAVGLNTTHRTSSGTDHGYIDQDVTSGASPTFIFPHVTKATTGSLSTSDVSSKVISNYGQASENTLTLPTAAAGYNGMCVIGTAGAGAFHLKAAASDKIYLDGTALDDGDKVSIATPSVGDYFTFWTFQTGASAYDWIVTTGSGTLTDGGA